MKKIKPIIICLSYLFILIVIKYLFFKSPFYTINTSYSGINLKPFNTLLEYTINFNSYNTNILINVFLSLLIFVPLSILLGINEKKNKNTNYFLVLSIVTFSILSRLFRIGYLDIDIIILRIIISYFAYYLINVIFKKNLEGAI